jgi:hypothetical protein
MAAPWDDVDRAIMRHLAAVHTAVDPPPPDLNDRVLFAIDLENLAVEVARQSTGLLAGAGARSGAEARTITFDADSLTIMITIADRSGGLVRIDGWLAPGGPRRVELRSPGSAGRRSVTADEAGRFVLDEIPHGLAQLVVHPPPGTGTPGVVTSSLAL